MQNYVKCHEILMQVTVMQKKPQTNTYTQQIKIMLFLQLIMWINQHLF